MMRAPLITSALALTIGTAAPAGAATLDDYIVFMIFDCTIAGLEDFDVQDTRDAATGKLGFTPYEEDGERIRYRNDDGALVAITASETAPSCSLQLPQDIWTSGEWETYPFDVVWNTYEDRFDLTEAGDGLAGGVTWKVTLEWGYRAVANMVVNPDETLVFSSTTFGPE